MINVPNKVDLNKRMQSFEQEAQELEHLLQQHASDFAEHDLVIERKGTIVGLKCGRFIPLQIRFGWNGQDLYWVINGFSEFDGKAEHAASFETKDEAIKEFKAAIPRIVTELYDRREELAVHGIA